jgi:hypothetical protein
MTPDITAQQTYLTAAAEDAHWRQWLKLNFDPPAAAPTRAPTPPPIRAQALRAIDAPNPNPRSE